jgi:cytochrome c-type biogenesis protein
MTGLFLAINALLTSGTGLALAGSFLWGMVSVLFSPCHLASIPLIIGYVGGQKELVHGRRAALYAGAFSLGLFTTIALLGVACALLGRMLGDIGPWWTILVGAVLVWVALDMLGVARCSMSGGLMGRLKVRGVAGALVLGLAYGLLSGSCTFGFIAPILAMVTIQNQLGTGILMIVLFGLGHCLPIVAAGSSTALVRRLLESGPMSGGAIWFKRAAGTVIGLLGVYFIVRPFVDAGIF